MTKSPTRSLRFQLILSHVIVAVVTLIATGGLVTLLAPRFFSVITGQHSTRPSGSGHGTGQGQGPLIAVAVEQALWWGLLLGLVAAIILGTFASRRILRTLDSIRQATRRLAAGDYSATLPLASTFELEQLSDDISLMADNLAATEKRRTRLIGEVSHEMRTPLTVIDGQVEAMIDGVLPLDAENLALLTEESRRLRRLADDLSAVSRAEEGRMSLEIRRISIGRVIDGVLERLEPQLQDAQLGVTRDIDLGVVVKADPDRIAQVITNLVGNAIRATPPGGVVSVSCVAAGKYVRVEVSDTGVGIAADELPKIFERFYRGSAERIGAGSGIGLTIARQLAMQHGGTLVASSEGLGKGATFTLLLPRDPA